LAIESLLNRKVKLTEVIGEKLSIRLNDQECEVICLPHPSGASTWHRMQPGINLLEKALQRLAEHPDWKATFP
jgi:uracil-DNA glycosylase